MQCPVLICHAEDGDFFKGKPLKLKEALGRRVMRVAFTSKEAAENHCHFGASAYANQVLHEWFRGIIDDV